MSYWISPNIYATSQSTTENYSVVRVDLYFDRDSGGAWNNYTTYGYIIVDGQRQDFSVGSYGTSSRTHLTTKDFRVYHNSDGSKSLSYQCYYNADNLPYVGALSSNGSFNCPTIPRAAPITSVSYSTIYSAFNVGFTSYSSSFSYKLRVSIPNVVALETYGNYTSGMSKTLSVDKQKYLTDYLCKNGKTSASLGFVIETYSGSAKIGESSESIKTFVKPSISVLSGMSVSGIDSSVSFTLSKTTYWGYYGHSLTIKYGSLILYSGAYSNSVSVTDSNKMNALYEAMKNSVSGNFTAVLTTTYGNYTIGSHEKTASGSLTNIAPTLGGLTYYDGNSSVSNVTGNNQMIIQNKSSLVITIPSYSLKKKAAVKSFKLSYNGKSYDVSAGNKVTIGAVDKTGNMTASLVLTDSRGQSVTVTKVIAYTAYSLPQINWEYYRSNSTGKKDLLSGTYIYIKPSYSVANIAGNSINSSMLKIGTETVSTNVVNGVGVTYGSSYAISKSYTLTLTVQDKLLGSTTISGTIAVAELPMNITKDKTGIAFGTVASNGQITLGKPTVVSGTMETKNYFVAANNQGLRVKDTGGTAREIIFMNPSNQTVLPNNDVIIKNGLTSTTARIGGLHTPNANYIGFYSGASGSRYGWIGRDSSTTVFQFVAEGSITSFQFNKPIYVSNIYSSDWLRTTGTGGWYSQTYGGGINMSDTTWVRVYNGKKFYVNNTSGDSISTTGGVKASTASITTLTPQSNDTGSVGTASLGYDKMYCHFNYLYNGGEVAVYSNNNSSRVNRLLHYNSANYCEFYSSNYGAFGIYYTVSDISLKNSIIPTKIKALDKVNRIKLYDFYWNNSSRHQSIGFLSQQLETVEKEYVTETKDDDGILSLMPNTPILLPLAIKAIKELYQEIQFLKDEIKILKGE